MLVAVVLSVSFTVEADVRRVFREPRYDRGMLNQHICQPIDEAAWIWHKGIPAGESASPAVFVRFRKEFESDGSPFEIDVSADERFVLFLDGKFVARGPNRGWTENWQYQTYEVSVPAGWHVFEAAVSHLGSAGPVTQMSYRGGFVLKASGAYDTKLTTGKAEWKVGLLTGTTMSDAYVGHGAMGCRSTAHGTGYEDEIPADWTAAAVIADPIKLSPSRFNWGLRRAGWMLYPSEIPDQTENLVRPGTFVSGSFEGVIPAHEKRTVLWDLGDYYCYYPDLVLSGGKGAKVVWHCAEALVDAKGRKGNRGDFKGRGVWSRYDMYDSFLADGRKNARFTTPWWRCGRWIVLEVETADEPLEVGSVGLIESRYPCEMASEFVSPDDPSLAPIQQIALRSMQCCNHEMLMDCPFFEQQMYPADTRIQLMTLTMLSSDDRMIRRAMEIYDLGRRDDGFVPNNWPTRKFQESAVMSLNYLMMYGDYVMWHRNDGWLKARFPGVANTLLAFRNYENANGLLENLPGSGFIDWVDKWGDSPLPVGRGEGPSAIENLYYVHALQSAAKLADAVGETGIAAVWRAKAAVVGAAVVRTFWTPEKGLLADDAGHTKFSEHAQVFAKYDRGDLILKRLDLWRGYLGLDLKTCLETPVGYPYQRSDCHAWGSHPIYHLRASIAGIRPAAPGFARVCVAPSPGSLKSFLATVPHPSGGKIQARLEFKEDGSVSGAIDTPVPGGFEWKERRMDLRVGLNRIEM